MRAPTEWELIKKYQKRRFLFGTDNPSSQHSLQGEGLRNSMASVLIWDFFLDFRLSIIYIKTGRNLRKSQLRQL